MHTDFAVAFYLCRSVSICGSIVCCSRECAGERHAELPAVGQGREGFAPVGRGRESHAAQQQSDVLHGHRFREPVNQAAVRRPVKGVAADQLRLEMLRQLRRDGGFAAHRRADDRADMPLRWQVQLHVPGLLRHQRRGHIEHSFDLREPRGALHLAAAGYAEFNVAHHRCHPIRARHPMPFRSFPSRCGEFSIASRISV